MASQPSQMYIEIAAPKIFLKKYRPKCTQKSPDKRSLEAEKRGGLPGLSLPTSGEDVGSSAGRNTYRLSSCCLDNIGAGAARVKEKHQTSSYQQPGGSCLKAKRVFAVEGRGVGVGGMSSVGSFLPGLPPGTPAPFSEVAT